MKYSENDYNERHAECPEGMSISHPRSGEYRDESACVGLQPEANDEPGGHKTADRGDQGLISPFYPTKTGALGLSWFPLNPGKSQVPVEPT